MSYERHYYKVRKLDPIHSSLIHILKLIPVSTKTSIFSSIR